MRTMDMTPLAFSPAALTVMPPAISRHTAIPDHDIEHIVARFPQHAQVETQRSAQSVGALLAQSAANLTDFQTTTFGDITFRRVDPLRETEVVADKRLQSRLEDLCQTLRSKY